MTGYCPHGEPEPMCDGGKLTAPCQPAEYVFCAHGVTTRKRTRDGQPACSFCRGVTRQRANRDTYRPPRRPRTEEGST